jgi:tetratricopeptide (TPR) repeat protein
MRCLAAASALCLAGLVALARPVCAGLYIPVEPPLMPEADAQAFLAQLGKLRGYGPPDFQTVFEETPHRRDYLQKVEKLREAARRGRLSPDEQASLGGYLIRLRRTQAGHPDYEEAVRALEAARRENPRHFATLANLGTVYQLTGRLDAAEHCLLEAEALAPAEWRKFERYHLLLVRLRGREQLALGRAPLDQLFSGPGQGPVRFAGPGGTWEPGRLADVERAKLPGGSVEDAAAIVKQLLLWLPDDGRLHWLLGELCNAQGNVRATYEAMNAAVDLFRLSTPQLKERRVLLQEALAWRELWDRLETPERRWAWVSQALALGLAAQAPVVGNGDPSPELVAAAGLVPQRANPFEQLPFGDGAEEPPAPPPPDLWANFDWRAWTVVAVGGLLVVGLLVLQVRQVLARRAAARGSK